MIFFSRLFRIFAVFFLFFFSFTKNKIIFSSRFARWRLVFLFFAPVVDRMRKSWSEKRRVYENSSNPYQHLKVEHYNTNLLHLLLLRLLSIAFLLFFPLFLVFCSFLLYFYCSRNFKCAVLYVLRWLFRLLAWRFYRRFVRWHSYFSFVSFSLKLFSFTLFLVHLSRRWIFNTFARIHLCMRPKKWTIFFFSTGELKAKKRKHAAKYENGSREMDLKCFPVHFYLYIQLLCCRFLRFQ